MKKNRKTSEVADHSPKKSLIQLSDATVKDLFGKNALKNLFAPIDISSIVFFRIIFGFILLIEVFRYFSNQWIGTYWIEPTHLFTFWPFDFLKPLTGDGMYFLFGIMGISAFCVMIGLFYRISMALFFLCFTYTFLLEQAVYLNHFYLVVLVSFLMIFIPANKSNSLDARFRKDYRRETIPAWCLWLLRFMIGITYFYGGIAKINSDWLQAEPIRLWLYGRTNIPVIGPFLSNEWMMYFLAYSGLLLDLLIVPALLYKKTRKWGFIFIIAFHLLNTQLFSIGIFPWFMITATTLFLEPSWYRNFLNGIKTAKNKWLVNNETVIATPATLMPQHKFILLGLGIWTLIQLTVPLRHFFIPGDVHWTEQGHVFSWHMKLRSKRGKGSFMARDKKSGQEYQIDPKTYISSRQISKMLRDPNMIWQFTKWVKDDFKQKGIDVEVYANISASLNGRKYQQLIDPTIDIASQPVPIMPAKWIIPLTTSLNERLELNPEKANSKEEVE